MTASIFACKWYGWFISVSVDLYTWALGFHYSPGHLGISSFSLYFPTIYVSGTKIERQNNLKELLR